MDTGDDLYGYLKRRNLVIPLESKAFYEASVRYMHILRTNGVPSVRRNKYWLKMRICLLDASNFTLVPSSNLV